MELNIFRQQMTPQQINARTVLWWAGERTVDPDWMPVWYPQNRPQPLSCWADIKDRLWQQMAHRDMPMTRDDYLQMIAYHRLAYENALRGSASEETWSCLALASNIALILAENGYGEDEIPLIEEAQDGLLRAKARGDAGRQWRMDGTGARLMGQVLDVLDQQLEIASRGEIVEARNILLQRMADQEAAELARGDLVK